MREREMSEVGKRTDWLLACGGELRDKKEKQKQNNDEPVVPLVSMRFRSSDFRGDGRPLHFYYTWGGQGTRCCRSGRW